MAGKGSARRPQLVDNETMADNWARIFGRPKCTQCKGTGRGVAFAHRTLYCSRCGGTGKDPGDD